MQTVAKTTRLPMQLVKAIEYRTKKENVDESTAVRQLLNLGVLEYGVKLYSGGKITLREASILCGVSVREILDALMEHGVRGNITYDVQKKSLDIIKNI